MGRDQAPRLSASGAKRNNECAASLPRSYEMYQYLLREGIDGPQTSDVAERGTSLHDVCSRVPYACPDLGGPEVFDLPAKIREVESSLGMSLSGYERYVLANFLEKRDAFITMVIDSHPLGRDGVEEVELALDKRRLYQPFTAQGDPLPIADTWPAQGANPLREKSGLPDVHVVVKGGGYTVVGCCDYKTGYSEYDSADNPQLEELLGLMTTDELRRSGKAPNLGFAAIIAETALGEPITAPRYEAADLERCRQKLLDTAKPIIAFLDRMTATPAPVAGELDPKLDRDLDKAARIGSHCLYCDGKLCCGAIKMEAAKVDYALNHKYDKLLDAKLINPDGTVNTATVSQALHIYSALSSIMEIYQKVGDEAKEIARQVAAKGGKIDNIEMEPGRKRIAVAEKDPRKLHALVEPLTGQDYATFLESMDPKISGTNLRAFLADQLKLKENKVVDTLLASAIASGMDALYSKLGSSLLTGDDMPTFQAGISPVSPEKIAEYLGTKLGVDPDKAVLEAATRLSLPESELRESINVACGSLCPVCYEHEQPRVKVTGEIADVIQETAAELAAKHEATTARELAENSPAAKPAEASPEAPAAPKRRRRRTEAPALPAAGLPKEIPVATEVAPAPVGESVLTAKEEIPVAAAPIPAQVVCELV